MPETDPRTIDQKLIEANFFSDQEAVYELFTQMRRDDPVHWAVRDDGVSFWSVFKHAECRAVLDHAVLFNTGTTGQIPPFAAELDIVSKKGFGVGESILTTDPPRHTKVRAVFEGPFKPKAMVQPHRMADNLRRKAMLSIQTCATRTHTLVTTWKAATSQGPRSLDNIHGRPLHVVGKLCRCLW